LNARVTDIAYRIVAIIKRTHNYGNDSSPVNVYYQTFKELKELNKADTISETASIIRSSKGASTLDRTWYKNLWKGKRKVEIKEPEEFEK